MSETLSQEPIPETFEGVTKLLYSFVDTVIEWEVEANGREVGTPTLNGTIRPFYLPTETTSELGLGSLVRCRVIGSDEPGMGIAMIVKSVNPFNRTVQGFYIQRAEQESEGRGYQVWQAPAEWPKKRGAYWGIELLDKSEARIADEKIATSLVKTIQKHAQFKAQ